jgi:hypothetical protein
MTPVARQKLQSKVLDVAIGLLVLILPALLLLAENHLQTFVSRLSLKAIVRVSITLLSLLAWVLFLLWRFWPRLKFEPRLGIYQDQRSGIFYCPSCRSKKLLSPLLQQEDGWQCRIKECGQFYSNPDYARKRPPAPPG